MDFIFVSTVLSRAALYGVERLCGESVERKKERTELGESGSGSEAPIENGPSTRTESETISTEAETRAFDISTVDEDNVESVEKAIATLRAQASELTSADTFVQYARVTRQATKLEKRLKELKKDEDDVIPGVVDFERIAGAMSQVLTDQAARRATRTIGTRKQILGIGIRIVLMLTLWYRFSSTSSTIISIPCAALRPMAFLFRRQSSGCLPDDWMCAAADERMCSVSYMVAAGLCNAALGAFVTATERVWKSRT